MIKAVHLTNDDVRRREHVYGKPPEILRGNILINKPKKHGYELLSKVPAMIATRYMDVQIFMELFFC